MKEDHSYCQKERLQCKTVNILQRHNKGIYVPRHRYPNQIIIILHIVLFILTYGTLAYNTHMVRCTLLFLKSPYNDIIFISMKISNQHIVSNNINLCYDYFHYIFLLSILNVYKDKEAKKKNNIITLITSRNSIFQLFWVFFWFFFVFFFLLHWILK